MHTLLAVPITIREVVFGSLYLTDPQSKPTFTQADESAARTLASAAAVAVDHAQLFQRERSAAKFMAASRQITTELLADPDPAVRPLQLIVDRACALTDAEQAIVLVPADTELPGEDDQTLVVTAAAGIYAAEVLGQRVPMQGSTTGAVFRSGTAKISQSLRHPIQAFGEAGERPGIVMPLRANRIVIGVLVVARPKGEEPFDESYLELVRDFADHAAVALTLAAAQESQREADRERSVAADRDRIAQDLHDHVIQQLFATGMSVQATIARADSPVLVTDRLTHTVDDLQTVVEDIRATIYRLQRPAERAGDFRQRMRDTVAGLTADSPIRATLRISGPMSVIGTELADQAEAATSEAISNAVRHSGAKTLRITVTVTDQLVIDIIDDGCGIPADNQRSSGLTNLRRRAKHASGRCQITTPPAGGTHIRWRAPYDVPDANPSPEKIGLDLGA
jgi:signal transduction histidine kinase